MSNNEHFVEERVRPTGQVPDINVSSDGMGMGTVQNLTPRNRRITSPGTLLIANSDNKHSAKELTIYMQKGNTFTNKPFIIENFESQRNIIGEDYQH